MMSQVILDTDIGTDVDDAFALGLAVSSPDLKVLCVTIVSGDVSIRARIAARLLSMTSSHGLHVYEGERKSLDGQDHFAWFGHEGKGLNLRKVNVTSSLRAAEHIVALSRLDPDLEIISIGPLTNLAVALRLDPTLPKRIKRLTIMGGHLREVSVGGVVLSPGIDYNLCSDPQSSLNVLRAGFRITLIPADITVKVWIRDSELNALESGTLFAKTLAKLVRIWSPIQRRVFAKHGARISSDNKAFMHDPLTILSIVEEECFDFQDILIDPTIREGVLLTPLAPRSSSSGIAVRAAMNVDVDRARATIINRIARI